MKALVACLLLVALWAGETKSQLVSDSDFVRIDTVTFSVPLIRDTTFSLLVRLSNKTRAQVLAIPLSYAGLPNLRIDNTVIDADGNVGVTQQTIGQNAAWSVRSSIVDSVNKTILLAYAGFGSPLPPSNGPLVRVHFKLLATPVTDTIFVDSTSVPPSNRLALTDSVAVERTPQFTRGLIRLKYFGPAASGLTVGAPQDRLHLANHTPAIAWLYSNELGAPQSSFQVEVGTDNNWSSAEMWQSGIRSGAATSIVYAGSPLLDGHTYFCRIRVSDGTLSSLWTELSFRMNSAPSVPTPLTPGSGALVLTLTPNLSLAGQTDPEGDTLTYYFEVYGDSALTLPLASAAVRPLPSWITAPLPDNKRAWWRAHVSDGYESSAYGAKRSFWVDGIPQAPGPAIPVFPANQASLTADSSYFVWHPAVDPDPFDTLRYRLDVSLSQSMSSPIVQQSLADTSKLLPAPLAVGHTYYWRVSCFDKRPGDSSQSSVSRFSIGSTALPGDLDHSGSVSSADIIFMVNYVFKGGPSPNPKSLADVNADCQVTSADIIYLVNYVFKGGPAPKVGCA